MAGVAGFEPTDARVKVWCLTPWLHPNKNACFYETSKTVGWVKGLEPSTPGTTIRCSNQLSYTHHRENGTPEGTRTPGLLLRRQLLYPTELLAHISGTPALLAGAGEGNRTLVSSLEGWCSTIELHPQAKKG